MALPAYQIYALKYAGPFVRPACMMTWFQDMDKTVLVNYYIFVIRGEEETIVVDCGVRPELARKRELINYLSPVEALKRMDVEASQVRHLVATHIHFDHISGIRLTEGQDLCAGKRIQVLDGRSHSPEGPFQIGFRPDSQPLFEKVGRD